MASRTDRRAQRSTGATTGTARTLFRVHAPHAHSVCLAGTFNGWDPGALPMMRRVTGEWTIELDLAPGRYEYKFVVDEKWCCARGGESCPPPAPPSVANPFGSVNHVKDV